MRTAWLMALMLTMTLGFGTANAQVQPPRRQPLPPPVYPNPPSLPPGAFCLADNPANPPLAVLSTAPINLLGRDLNGTVTQSMRQNNGQCRAACANSGFAFSGTQSSSYCFCGQSAGSFGASTNCTARCTGSGFEACGGPNANTVMQTGVVAATSLPNTMPPIPPFGMQMPVAPPGGAQCVIDVAGFAYRHYESHTWMPNGSPTPTGNGMSFPLSWSVTGGGFHQDLSVVGAHTQVDDRTWTLDMSPKPPVPLVSAVTWVTINKAGGGVTFGESGVQGSGGFHETQVQIVDGQQSRPGLNEATASEFTWTGLAVDWSSARPHGVDIVLNDGNKGTIHDWRPGSTGWIHCRSNVP